MGNLIDVYEHILKHKDDKEKAEELMAQYIEEFINTCAEEKRQQLRQKQWVIDSELKKIKNPIARLNKMVELFWLGVKEFEVTLKSPSTNNKKIEKQSKKSNIIVQFKR